MSPDPIKAAAVCYEIAEEFQEVAVWFSHGLTPSQVRRGLTELQGRKLANYGFALTSAISEDGKVLFSLRHAANGELCASMDVDPATGEVVMQHTCLTGGAGESGPSKGSQ